jgi:hypothetical protein
LLKITPRPKKSSPNFFLGRGYRLKRSWLAICKIPWIDLRDAQMKPLETFARTGNLQNSLDRLAGLKGGQFDAAFKQQVIADHEKVIVLFEEQAKHGTDPDLKAFAQKYLPHLREHVEMARALPISSDNEGPPEDSVNTILQNPAGRLNIPR